MIIKEPAKPMSVRETVGLYALIILMLIVGAFFYTAPMH